MGLSFHDDTSIEEAVGSLRFAANPVESNSETETIDSGVLYQERREDDTIGVEPSTMIELVDRV